MLVPRVDEPHARQARHRRRPVHVGVAHQREQDVGALGGEGLREHVGHLVSPSRRSLPLKTCSARRKARHSRPMAPPRSAAAVRCRSGGARGPARAGALPAPGSAARPRGRLGGRRRRALGRDQLDMFCENSASSARATCTPPALAKVSSGPVTVKPPSTVAPSRRLRRWRRTTPEERAREAPRPSMPRPSIVQRCAAW